MLSSLSRGIARSMGAQRRFSVLAAAAEGKIRNDWTREEISEIFNQPLLELAHHAGKVHRMNFKGNQVQKCTLLSIKTGGCPENCSYCPQSSLYKTDVEAERIMSVEAVVEKARAAKEGGSTRFCMGAAWREGGGRWAFKQVLQMAKEVRSMDMEVCMTLGMLDEAKAKQLKEAGVTAYNHNIDTSPEYYPKVITSRSFEDRLKTLENVRNAGISVCSGGIIGLGEENSDRIGMLHTLATLPQHPESVPVNALVPVEGTPLEDQPRVSVFEMMRMISTARLVMPSSMVRLSAGRSRMEVSEQALCFMCGANSIFTGEKLLTTANPDFDSDMAMFNLLGLEGKPATIVEEAPQTEEGGCGSCGPKADEAEPKVEKMAA